VRALFGQKPNTGCGMRYWAFGPEYAHALLRMMAVFTA